MDDYEMEECELVDRLSELPQALIHSILSFLPMRDVVSTSLLSKKWKNLWATVPCLNIWVDMIHVDQHFVNRLLMLWKVSWLGEGQEDRLLEDVLRQILSTIQHVEKVTLSYWCGQVLGGSQKKHLLSPLQNVEFLKLHSCRFELGDMMDFLGIFPNLKMLVIGHLRIPNLPENCMEFEANLSKSFLLQLKIVEITSFFFDSSKLWFFELLLKRASMLEKLVIRVKDIDSHQQEHLSEVAQKLQSMPRSSPTAKVIFNST